MLLSSCLLFYMCCFFIIDLFAGLRYAGHIFNAVSAREGDLRVPQPERPPSRSHPVGHGRSSALLYVLRCWLLSVCCGTQNGTLCRSGSCILRYLWWYAMPISFLDSLVLIVIRCADLVSGFFATYGDTLRRSGSGIPRYLWWYATPIWFRDSSIFMVVRCVDLVVGFFGTYGDMLCRSDP